jgi:hypothetical protein
MIQPLECGRAMEQKTQARRRLRLALYFFGAPIVGFAVVVLLLISSVWPSRAPAHMRAVGEN